VPEERSPPLLRELLPQVAGHSNPALVVPQPTISESSKGLEFLRVLDAHTHLHLHSLNWDEISPSQPTGDNLSPTYPCTWIDGVLIPLHRSYMSTKRRREEDWRGELGSHLLLSSSKLRHASTPPPYRPRAKRSSRRFWEERGFATQERGRVEVGQKERGAGGIRRSGMDAPSRGVGRSLVGWMERGDGAIGG
jgi:hypothetical protein